MLKSRSALFALLWLAATSSAGAQAYDFGPGEALAIDGDTLRIGSQRIRLSAMDAPELSQVCRSDAGRLRGCLVIAPSLAPYLVKRPY